MEDELNGRRPQWKTTLMEDNLKGRVSYWKSTIETNGKSLETDEKEDVKVEPNEVKEEKDDSEHSSNIVKVPPIA